MTTDTKNNPWIVQFQPNPQARYRLFCFPHAGGGTVGYRTWFKDLPDDIEVCAIRLPGRESRLTETPFTDVHTLAQTLSTVLEPYFDRPFAFFGHSLGSIVSFEVTRLLESQRKHKPIHLFVSAHRAPHMPNRNKILHHLPKDEFIEGLRSYNGTPEIIFQEKELMELLLPMLQADFTMSETYVSASDTLISCPITGFGGDADDTTSEEEMDTWDRYTTNRFKLHMYPGDHFYLRDQQKPVLQVVSQDLRRG
ncbi:MAG: alpha/beta fold hydrolase [Chloroflexota bacterium]